MGTSETLGAFCGFAAVVAFVLLFISPPSAAALGTASVYGLVLLGVALGGVVGGGFVYARNADSSTTERDVAAPSVDAAPNRHENGDGVSSTTSPASTAQPTSASGPTGPTGTAQHSTSSRPATESSGDLGDLFDSGSGDDLDDEFDWVDDELDD